MTTELKIFEYDPRIKAFHPYWQMCRDIIAGARVVIPKAEEYLTREPDMDDVSWRNYVKRVPFIPFATDSHDNLVGLMLRVQPKCEPPKSYEDIIQTITAQGFTIFDLDEDLKSEKLITNYTGLVTDYPVAPKGLSLAKAIDQGYRPFISMYKAESILGIDLDLIGNRQRVVRVRLLDNEKTVRELRLDDGVYSITIHRNIGGTWVADAPIIPTRAGATMDEIPFTLDSTSRDFMPTDAPLGRVCQLNVDHYVKSANLATEEYYSCVRIFFTQGFDDAAAAKLPGWSGARWNASKSPQETEANIIAPTDNVIADLRASCTEIEKKIAKIGLSMIDGEEASNISTETERLRSYAKNASLANITHGCDRSMNDQLKWVSWWLGLEEDAITFESSTDFGAAPLDGAALEVRTGWYRDNIISHEEWAAIMKENGALRSEYDSALDREKIKQDMPDRPTETFSNDEEDELEDE